ncbi:C39 family peptidase [Paenibacillus sp. FSL H3-0333]|uniref:C39 family peptidase n=1 Tax=Paenibacillus sp. FSL H3-0333 TaxID=2921373 RepID=UPI0030FAC5B9
MKNIVYYSQKDPRWKNTKYSIRSDKSQTIATSACGPTSLAMVISTLTETKILPPEAAKYAVDNGYRTNNEGTSWAYFNNLATKHGLTCKQTPRLDDAKAALSNGLLVIASMGKGHFTGGGHYILLVGINENWIDVYDPNHLNKSYGTDGKVKVGIKDDGIVSAIDSVFKTECKQYWIFDVKEIKVPEKADPVQTTEKDDGQVDKVKDILTKDNSVFDGFLKDNINYVSVDVLKALGHKVSWDNNTKKLYIS